MDKQAITAVIELRDCVTELASLVKEASNFLSIDDNDSDPVGETKYIDLNELTELVNKI